MNVIPQLDPCGGAISTGTGAGERYFAYSFNTGSSTIIDIYATTNSTSLIDEQMVSLYQLNQTTNLLFNDITTTTNVSLLPNTTSPNRLAFRSSLTAVKCATLNNLTVNTNYIFVMKTTSNDTSTVDVALSFRTLSDANIPLTYYSTQISLNTDGTISPFINRAFYNIIPDVDPFGFSVTTTTRFFGFSFTAPSTSINAFIRTNSSTTGINSIVSIYKSDNTTNLISNGITTSTNTIKNSSTLTFTASYSNNTGNVDFTINNLTVGGIYYIVSKTTSNSTGEDIGLALEQLDGASIILSYYSTQTVFTTDQAIAPYVSNEFNSVVPDKDPNNNTTTGSGIRFFGFQFTPGDTEINVFTKTNSSSATDEIIVNLYKVGESTNLLSNSVEIVDPALVLQSANWLVLTSSRTNTGPSPTFTFKNLLPDTPYVFVTRTTNNNTDTGTAGPDISLSFKKTDGTQIPFTYVSTSRVLNLDGTIPSFPQAVTSTRTLNELIPNTNPIGTAFVGGTGTATTPRYFLWNFNTGSNTDVNVFTNTGNSTGDSMLYLYKPGVNENLLGTKLVNPSGWVIRNAISNELTFAANTYNNNTNIPSFGFTGLVANTTYKFVMKTTTNSSSFDVSASFEGGQTVSNLLLTYEATSTTMINTDATFTVDGTAIIQGGSFTTTGGSVTVGVTISTNAIGATSVVTGASNLKLGSNIVSVVVTAMDGFTRKTTTFTVVRAIGPAIVIVSANEVSESYNPDNNSVTMQFSFDAVSGASSYKLLGSNKTTVLATSASNSINYEGAQAYQTLNYYIVAYDTDGAQISAYQPLPIPSVIIKCLPRGTKILTPTGYRLVEDFANGDLVVTDDGREVPVRVHLSSTSCSDAKSAPVRIAAKSFFGEYPVAPIRVSSWHAFKVGPGNQWLLPKDVLDIDGVVQEPFGQAVEYYHFELPDYLRDNLVLEGGAVVESYGIPWKTAAGLLGKVATYIMDKEAGYCRRITGV